MKIVEQTELTPGQKSRIVELWNAEYPLSLAYTKDEKFDEYLNGLSGIRYFLLFDQAGEIRGWAITFNRENARWFAIIVDSTIQGRGYGVKLMNRLKETENKLFGWVIDHNNSRKLNGDKYISPLGFYKKIGFRVLENKRLESAKMSAVCIEWNA